MAEPLRVIPPPPPPPDVDHIKGGRPRKRPASADEALKRRKARASTFAVCLSVSGVATIVGGAYVLLGLGAGLVIGGLALFGIGATLSYGLKRVG